MGSHTGSVFTRLPQAFRPGLVDMTEDQLAVNQNAITLQSNNLDLDALLPDLDWYVFYYPQLFRPALILL